jgi:hypothetical protein
MCTVRIDIDMLLLSSPFLPFPPLSFLLPPPLPTFSSTPLVIGLGAPEPEKIIVVRARATECIGLCALAVGEPAKGIVHDAMSLAVTGLDLGFSELNEFTFGFFCNMCELLGADFVNYLPVVMAHVS